MRKSYKLSGEICGNCAAKIENKIGKLDGVDSVRVNVMTLKFTLEAADDLFEGLLEESLKIFKAVEPDCVVHV